jgi:predicted RNA binding protein YcfA (HicA-like mRNA interferase family)
MGLSDLPLASGKEHQKVFEALGWRLRREATHLVMTHSAHPGVHLSIPNHKEVRRGTLKQLVHDADLTDKQYRVFYDEMWGADWCARATCMKVWRQEQAKTKTEYRGPSLCSG